MNEPIHVTDSSFEREVLGSELPVLTDFWADWCGPCHAIAPVLEEIAEEHAGQLKIAKLDVDDNPRTAAQYGVRSIPTLIVFEAGKPVERLVGAMSKEALLARIRPRVSTATIA